MSDHLPGDQKLLNTLFKNELLNVEQYLRCKKKIGLTPDLNDWRLFLDIFLLFLGTSLLALGIIFFFAYNWQDLHKFTKFALIGSGIFCSIMLTHLKGIDSLGGKAGLLIASILTGTLLAVYGQIYQTGADPYQLFLAWAAFITVWVWIARLQALWLILLLLYNLALIMYWSEFISTSMSGSFLFSSNPLLYRLSGFSSIELNELLVLCNGLALIIWEAALKKKRTGFSDRWGARVLATYIVIMATQTWLSMLFSYNTETEVGNVLAVITYIAVITTIILYYLSKVHDLYMLAISYFSITVSLCALVGKGINDVVAGFFVLSFIALGLSSAFAISLKKTAQAWRAEHEQA